MENNNYKEIMSKKSDKDLIEIVFTRRKDYQEDAVFAAETELNGRKIDPVFKEKYIKETQAEFDEIEYKLNKKLGWGWKVLCFLLPGVIPLLIFIIDFSNGYETRSNEALKWTGFGILFYISIFWLPQLFF